MLMGNPHSSCLSVTQQVTVDFLQIHVFESMLQMICICLAFTLDWKFLFAFGYVNKIIQQGDADEGMFVRGSHVTESNSGSFLEGWRRRALGTRLAWVLKMLCVWFRRCDSWCIHDSGKSLPVVSESCTESEVAVLGEFVLSKSTLKI